jgi:ubiquitin-protein ligase
MIPPEFRAERLRGDWKEMKNVRGPIIDWQAEGTPPHAYRVTYRLRSFVDERTTRDVHHVRFAMGPGYPGCRPHVVMLDTPLVFHPNVDASGDICIGQWMLQEGLGFLVIRVAKMLLYFDVVTNPDSASNVPAAAWYRANRRLFPLDRSVVFPDPFTGIASDRPRAVIVRGSRPARPG